METLPRVCQQRAGSACSNVSALNFNGQDTRLPKVQIAFSVEQTAAVGFCKQKL